jgi:hypothetical protein
LHRNSQRLIAGDILSKKNAGDTAKELICTASMDLKEFFTQLFVKFDENTTTTKSTTSQQVLFNTCITVHPFSLCNYAILRHNSQLVVMKNERKKMLTRETILAWPNFNLRSTLNFQHAINHTINHKSTL